MNRDNNTDAGQAQFLTLDEAAEFLQLKKSYIYKLVMRKVIPYFKYGRKLRFKAEDLEAWRNARLVAVPSYEQLQERAAKYCLAH